MLANLTRPAAGRPSLLRHHELITLFHEFGHVLHDVLARAEHVRYAGAETELDFVEAPSQMLEHWCWEPAVFNGFARHHQTGEPMPDELLAGLLAARTAASGVRAMQQLARATLDLAYHSADYGGDSTATLADVYAQHGFRHLEGTHLQSGFHHLLSATTPRITATSGPRSWATTCTPASRRPARSTPPPARPTAAPS